MTLRIAARAATNVNHFSIVEDGIRRHSSPDRRRGTAFVRYTLDTFFCIPPNEIDKHIVDGGQDRGIDAIYIDHKNEIINICSCKCVATFSKAKRNFPGDEIDKIISFLNDLMERNERLPDFSNGAVASKVREVWDLFEGARFYKVHLHLFSNQATLADAERQRLNDSLGRHTIELKEHGLYELAHGVVKNFRPKFKKSIKPSPDEWFKFKDGNIRGYIFRVFLKDFSNFVDENGRFDERLTASNVRYFLGLENSVNKFMQISLTAGDSNLFSSMNNGITIVCDQILGLNGAHPFQLINPQIVNGGQTAVVIHGVAKETLNALGEGSVVVKIIETSEDEIREKIAIASNTQSRIFGRDLRAYDRMQSSLAAALLSRGYFYKRKRGETAPTAGLIELDSARIGQALLCYCKGMPVAAKTQDVFDENYNIAFDESTTDINTIIACHNYYVMIESRRLEALAWQKSVSKNNFQESWVIEGHFHVLFVIGEMLRRSGNPLDGDADVNLLNKAFAVISRYVESHRKESNYRLFRLKASEDRLRDFIDADQSIPLKHPVQLALEI